MVLLTLIATTSFFPLTGYIEKEGGKATAVLQSDDARIRRAGEMTLEWAVPVAFETKSMRGGGVAGRGAGRGER